MSEWVKFKNCKEHVKLTLDAANSEDGVLFRLKNGDIVRFSRLNPNQTIWHADIDSFLICEPHPHRDMIIEWANTGRSVYVKHGTEWRNCGEPTWNKNLEYSFDPQKEKARYRVALMKCYDRIYVDTFNKEGQQKAGEVVRWLTDWVEVEV